MKTISRRSLRIVALLALVGLGVLVSLVPIEGRAGTALFGVVVALVLFLIYLGTIGEVERYADRRGFSPWFIYLGVLLLGLAWIAIRVGFLQAGR